MDSTQALVTIVGAGGLGAAVLALINGGIKWLNGTAGRERARNADMRTQRNEAWADAERERARANRADRNRGRHAEYAARCRRMLIEAQCVNEADIPPWPDLEPEPQAT